jgi:hypothetical protein
VPNASAALPQKLVGRSNKGTLAIAAVIDIARNKLPPRHLESAHQGFVIQTRRCALAV